MKKQTFFILLLIALVVSLFATPLGFEIKIFFKRFFLSEPQLQETKPLVNLKDYQWKLKDANWSFFSFEKSKDKVVIINFWNTWDVTCMAQLRSLQELYDIYGKKVDFYFITNELREPVETVLKYKDYGFEPIYLILDQPSPFDTTPPSVYIIDKNGNVVVNKKGAFNWNTKSVRAFIDKLLK